MVNRTQICIKTFQVKRLDFYFFFWEGLFTKHNSNLFSYVFLCTRRSCVAVE